MVLSPLSPFPEKRRGISKIGEFKHHIVVRSFHEIEAMFRAHNGTAVVPRPAKRRRRRRREIGKNMPKEQGNLGRGEEGKIDVWFSCLHWRRIIDQTAADRRLEERARGGGGVGVLLPVCVLGGT